MNRNVLCMESKYTLLSQYQSSVILTWVRSIHRCWTDGSQPVRSKTVAGSCPVTSVCMAMPQDRADRQERKQRNGLLQNKSWYCKNMTAALNLFGQESKSQQDKKSLFSHWMRKGTRIKQERSDEGSLKAPTCFCESLEMRVFISRSNILYKISIYRISPLQWVLYVPMSHYKSAVKCAHHS